MADIKYQIDLKDTATGKVFSGTEFPGAEVKLQNCDSEGTYDSDKLSFSEIGFGVWQALIDIEDTGFYLVQTSTDASPTLADVEGMNPIKIDELLSVNTSANQTVAGAKIFSGACEVTGAWTVAGTVDFTKDKLKIGGTTVTASAAELNILDEVTATKDELNILVGVTADKDEINKLSVSVGGEVDASKVLVADASKNVAFGTGSTTETNNTVEGILILGGTETINEDGALSVTETISKLDSSGEALALTLAAGTTGQIKICIMNTAGNNAVITPAPKMFGGTTVTLNAVGDSVMFIFEVDGWYIIGQNNIVIT